MAALRTGVALIALAVTLVGAAHGGRAARPPTGAARLRTLLVAAQVPLARGSKPAASSFPAAWAAFQRFAREGKSESLLFEFGVFESHYWGTSFEVELTRQSDRRQVHLVVHFPVAAYVAITRNLRATPCLPGAGCDFRCFFKGDDSLVPRPCRVATGGYPIGDMRLSERQSAPWIAAVESSPVFRALLARQVRPDGFEVWTE